MFYHWFFLGILLICLPAIYEMYICRNGVCPEDVNGWLYSFRMMAIGIYNFFLGEAVKVYNDYVRLRDALGALFGFLFRFDDEVALGNQTMVQCTDDGTLVPNKDGTLIPMSPSGTMVDLESDLGTMVINSDVDDQTMKRHDTGSSQGGKKYRPMFMDHFDKKDAEVKVLRLSELQQGNGAQSPIISEKQDAPTDEQQNHKSQTQVTQTTPTPEQKPQYNQSFSDGDFEFLKRLTFDELQQKINTLDSDMEREIDELRKRYQIKRQPILDAMDTKRKRSQNF